jgi:hypothetical protein
VASRVCYVPTVGTYNTVPGIALYALVLQGQVLEAVAVASHKDSKEISTRSSSETSTRSSCESVC